MIKVPRCSSFEWSFNGFFCAISNIQMRQAFEEFIAKNVCFASYYLRCLDFVLRHPSLSMYTIGAVIRTGAKDHCIRRRSLCHNLLFLLCLHVAIFPNINAVAFFGCFWAVCFKMHQHLKIRPSVFYVRKPCYSLSQINIVKNIVFLLTCRLFVYSWIIPLVFARWTCLCLLSTFSLFWFIVCFFLQCV